MMNRREFLSLVGIGGVASYLPVALAVSSNKINQSDVSTIASNSDGFIRVGTVTELQQKGQLSQDKILVIRSSSPPKMIVAVNPTCTHDGCTVNWEKDKNAFVCPCHRAQFTTQGKVLQGPARKPLATYVTKLEGDTILVKKAR